jgi:glycosyltransferase involved in cell wall biosynthesis
MQKISIAVAVYNEEKNIGACLSSVSDWSGEIIVVDGGSTDETLEIVQRYATKIIKTTNPPIFHINKQKALDACTGSWILQLDADEIVTEVLKKEIQQVVESKISGVNGYYIPRRNYFLGHFMQKGGLYPDYVIRLIRNGKARFPCKSVHEQITVDGKIGYLNSPLDHISYRTTADYWRKADSYTTLTAMEMKDVHVSKSVKSWLLYNVIYPIKTFLSLFFRHGGFIDGWYGFVFALHFPIAYRKFINLYES